MKKYRISAEEVLAQQVEFKKNYKPFQPFRLTDQQKTRLLQHIDVAMKTQNGCDLPCKDITNNLEHVIDLTKHTFTIDGQNWFDSCSYSSSEQDFIFEGEHDIGHNFSLFIKFLIHNYLQVDGYKLDQEEYSEIRRIIKNEEGKSTEKILSGMKLRFAKEEKLESST